LKKLKEKNNCHSRFDESIHVFPNCPLILHLIQEIHVFNSWVNGYLNDGLDILVGHIEMHLFQFFVDKVGLLVMQYKVSPTDTLWNAKDSSTISLWKEDVVGWAKLLARVSNLVPFCLIWGIDELKASEKERFVNIGISKYTEFWKLGMLKDDSYFRIMGRYVKY